MTNSVCTGNVLEVVTPVGGYVSGQAVAVGALVGVSLGTYAEGETAIINLKGVYTLAKKAADAIAQGAKVYLDAEDGITDDATAPNVFAGYAYEAAIGAASVVDVLLAH